MPQAGQDHRSPKPVTSTVPQNGQIVSAAGGMVFSIFRTDGVNARRMRTTSTIASAGAATLQNQIPRAKSESGGTTQKAIEMAISQ